jgi:hypothetical protein
LTKKIIKKKLCQNGKGTTIITFTKKNYKCFVLLTNMIMTVKNDVSYSNGWLQKNMCDTNKNVISGCDYKGGLLL